ncbi:MAG: serine/threonine-protein kinase, partial [Planctomycetota bacterium]|nr:serine/threonine-protein kinase [Planctomycetota bacterium]
MEKHSNLPTDQAILDLIRSYKFLRRYKIHRPLGQGGMGLVLLGEDRQSGDEVAIKVLLGKVSERGLQRFKREAKTLGVLNHPGTVRLRDYGTEPRPYLVMDYVKGRTLKQAVDESLKFEGRVPELSWTLDLFLQLSKVLSHCHSKGLLHRDIKPANVLLDSEDKAVLVDFGLVKRRAGSDDFIEGFTEKLSKTGEIVGTVSFMSPEQLGGKDFGELGPATDVWSLGATLFYCLTGRLPYEFSNMTEFVSAKLSTDPSSPRKFNPELPQWLDKLCLDCLNRVPTERPSLSAFQRALEHRSEG